MGTTNRVPVQVAVSRADKYHAFLTAGVIVAASLVLVLYGIWLASFDEVGAVDRSKKATTIIDITDWNSDQLVTLLDFDVPGMGELPEATQPQILQALQAVTDSASFVVGSHELVGTDDQHGKQGGVLGDDNRVPGPFQDDVVPEWERWRIKFQADSEEEYLAMLDSLNIHLGAVHQISNKIYFLANLTDDEPDLSEGTRQDEKGQRLYFRNVTDPMKRWERQQMTSAGVDLENYIVVQFYSEKLRAKLAETEKSVIDETKSLAEIKQTTFVCHQTDDGYEFRVNEIKYRPNPG